MDADMKMMAHVFSRARGLIARRPGYLAPGEVVCLVPCASVHTWFMREPIDVAFLDASGTVLRSIRCLQPWRAAACRGALWACERPSVPSAPWPEAGERLVLSFGDIAPAGTSAQDPEVFAEAASQPAKRTGEEERYADMPMLQGARIR